jgi:hypothetical protein
MDGQFGVDFGTVLGVIFEAHEQFDLAIGFEGLFRWYQGGDYPEAVQDINPRSRV